MRAGFAFGVFVLALAAGAGTVAAEPGARVWSQSVSTAGIERTVAEIGRSRIVAFRAAAESDIEQAPAFDVTPPGILEVISAPRLLAGEPVGYVRVRGLRAGVATLTVAEHVFLIDVVPARVPADAAVAAGARVVGPVAGACVWGTFSVGVERRIEPRDPDGRFVLRLPDGRSLESTRVSDASMGPDRRAVFEVDAETLDVGRCELTPVVLFEDASEQVGESISVLVIRPAEGQITQGEAEARYDVERPRRFQEARASVGRSAEASGGAYFNNFSSLPAVCFPVEVERAGLYQVFVRAMGTLAGGELPWVDVVVDGSNFAATGAPLVSMRWHRLAVGAPIWLEPGTRVITPYFANDFYVPDAADRNLLIDTVEVARVGPLDAGASGAEPPEEVLGVAALDGGDVAGGSGAGSMGSGSGMVMGGMGGEAAAMMASMGGGASGGGMVAAVDPMGLTLAPVRIALDRVLDGASVTGSLLVEGQAWTPRTQGQPLVAPDVALLVNGREIGRQRTLAPRFLIHGDEFDDGENRIELVASLHAADEGLDGQGVGVVARTPVQRVRVQRPAGSVRGTSPRVFRFGIHDPSWDARARELLRNEHYPRERAAVAMYSRETIRLTLPEALAGRFQVGVEAMGTNLEGAPAVAIGLESAREGPADLGVIETATWWDTRFVEPRELPPGPKTLLVTFTNDKYQPGVGDRNVWIQSLVLREVAAGESTDDLLAPIATLLFPRDGDEFFMAGAVIAELGDDRGVERVEVVVDGVQTGIRQWTRHQPGPFVLPLLARGLEPGEHRVSVRAFDARGNIGESPVATIRVLAEAPEQGTRYDRAVTMLDRFAFGPDGRELAAILAMGPRDWLADRLARSLDEPGELTAMGPGLIWFEDGRYEYGPPRRALEHAFFTPNPARARFVFWAQNHFSTWLRKAEGDRKWREHAEFARLGAAPFQDLLLASARSPAMLRYLDQDQSFAGRLNENYAREIMELHTLGVHGGYTQSDVTSLAGVLTGWTASTLGGGRAGNAPRGFQFRFDPGVSSGAAARVIGQAFPETPRSDRYDRALMAIETLASHPSTARYIATRLCESYCAVPAPNALVDALALVFSESGGDTAAMLVAMSEHPEFWRATRARRIATPLDYALRLARGAAYHQPWRISEYLQLAGFQIFDRSTPDGYPTEDAAYGDSNAMIQRWSLAQDASGALANFVPDTWRWDGLAPDRAWAQRVVDALAIGLTGRVLSERSNEAAIELLLSSDAPVSRRVQMIAPVVAQLPEANLK